MLVCVCHSFRLLPSIVHLHFTWFHSLFRFYFCVLSLILSLYWDTQCVCLLFAYIGGGGGGGDDGGGGYEVIKGEKGFPFCSPFKFGKMPVSKYVKITLLRCCICSEHFCFLYFTFAVAIITATTVVVIVVDIILLLVYVQNHCCVFVCVCVKWIVNFDKCNMERFALALFSSLSEFSWLP